MEMNEYQRKAGNTVLDSVRNNDAYLFEGLISEVGEIAGKRKRERRDGKMINPDAMKAEFGDVLWYLSQLAGSYGFSLEEVAQANLDKLRKRAEAGTLTGEGDQR
jgi:NTP pyrophosphatase (non-canonical NTP hydrolase)